MPQRKIKQDLDESLIVITKRIKAKLVIQLQMAGQKGGKEPTHSEICERAIKLVGEDTLVEVLMKDKKTEEGGVNK